MTSDSRQTAGDAPPLLNVANVLTGVRIILVPFLVVLLVNFPASSVMWRLIALAVFLVAATTDQLDGYLARQRGLVTAFGKIADPIADKALTGAALICLSWLSELSWWVTGVILFREIGITVLRMVVIRHRVMAASQGGKIKTATQIVAISVYLLPPAWTHSFSWIELGAAGLMVLAVAATVATGIDYVVQAVPVIRGMRQKPPVADAAPQLPAAPQVGVPPVNPVTAGPESAPAAGATEPGIEPPAAASVVPPGIKPPAAASPAAAQVAGRPALASSGLGASSGPRSRPVIPFRKVGAAGAQIEPDGGRVAPSLTGAASPTVPASPVPPAARPGAIPASPARPGAQLPAPPPAAEAVKPTRPVDGWPDPQVRRPAARPRPEPTPARRAPQWTELRTVMRAAEATPDSSAGQTSPTQLPSGGSPPAPTHPAPGLTPRPAGAPASPTPDATQLGDGTGTSASGSETAGQDAALAAAQAKLAELKRRLGWDAGPAGN